MLQYHTSVRSRKAEDTIRIAKRYASRLGITRVTDTTLLDNIGIPVFASIRPDASQDSLCVCAGKGLLPVEAQAGAYMEAIEFALSDQRYSAARKVAATVGEILDGATREEAFLDFCPRLGTEIGRHDPIEAVIADDLLGSERYLVPAELVFLPYDPPEGLMSYFGCHTNGLASGNSAAEASVHGLLEVIERDILSFDSLNRHAERLLPESLPEPARQILSYVERAGMQMTVNAVDNAWGLPFFSASLVDTGSRHPIYINGGYGCHFIKSVALIRAMTEAIQSRMSFIHGGRDDVIDEFLQYQSMTDEERNAAFTRSADAILGKVASCDFQSITEPDFRFSTIEECLDRLMSLLEKNGIDHILRVRHTEPHDELQVVKMIVPKMEFFTKANARVGKRLRDRAKLLADDLVRRTQPQ